MKKYTLFSTICSLILVAAILTAVSAFAAPGGKYGPKPQCPMKAFFYNFFDITEQQQQELEALRDDTRLQIKPYREQLEPLMKQLSDTLLADAVDTAKADALVAEIIDLQATILPIEMDAKVKAAQILTELQRADIAGVRTDITDFIDYLLAYPKLDDLKNKYSERIMRAMLDADSYHLNLTEEQKTAIIELRDETEDAIEPIADSLRALHDSFADTLLAAAIDTAAAAALIDQMIAPASEMAEIKYSAQIEASQILTAEQRRILRRIMNRHRGFGHQPPYGGK